MYLITSITKIIYFNDFIPWYYFKYTVKCDNCGMFADMGVD